MNVLPLPPGIPAVPRLAALHPSAEEPSGLAAHRRGRPATRPGLVLLVWLATLAALVTLTPASQRLSLVTWLLTAPGFEELFFRGLVHEGLLRSSCLARSGRPLVLANGVTALLFGALHAWARDPWTGLAVVLPALVIGQSYGRQRSVALAVAQHSVFNLVWLAWSLPALQRAGADVLAQGPTWLVVFLREFFA